MPPNCAAGFKPYFTRSRCIATSERRRNANRNIIGKKNEKSELRDELRGEFDLSELKDGVRGKYKSSYRAGTNVVLLSPDVAGYFPNEQAVNSALRTFIRGEAACAAARADQA